MTRELEEDPELLIGRAHPVDDNDILDERDIEDDRVIRADLFDDDPFADRGDLDYEDEEQQFEPRV